MPGEGGAGEAKKKYCPKLTLSCNQNLYSLGNLLLTL